MIYYLLTAAIIIFILCFTITLEVKADKKTGKTQKISKSNHNSIYVLDLYDALMRTDLSGANKF